MRDILPFAVTLARFRESRRLSQTKLAERADLSHSYVSRLETGSRTPTRECVQRLSKSLALNGPEADALLLSAGFAAGDPTAALDDPEVRAINALLDDEAAPLSYRRMCRAVLRSLIAGKPPALPAGYPEAV